MVGDISNDELANLAYNYRIGLPVGEEKAKVINNSQVVNELKGLRQEIRNKPIQQINVDELGNIIETISDGTIRKVTKLKTRSRL
jgi:hypothetical protein